MNKRVYDYDRNLFSYKADFDLRDSRYAEKKAQLLKPGQSLYDFADGYLYFGFHQTPQGWCYREWAPGATQLFLTGDFCNWDRHAYPMEKQDGGVWELFLPGKDALKNGEKVLTVVQHGDRELERIPLYATRVVQNPADNSWNGEIYAPEKEFVWTDGGFCPQKKLFIYECHIGMAQEDGKVGTYREFTKNVLPRVKKLGYNALQIMAIMEHPYYASFGYQVTNFFAASSRFGTPDELKELINAAHKMGICVLLDVVHSHASKNTREGLNEFDGTDCQFFHTGARGYHTAWDTKCFDYGKPEVIHFLLSNLKFWQTQYHFDGFRFDGVTSMLYLDHGLGSAFTDNSKYFSMNTDLDAVTYLQLANDLVREVNPNAITIAEDTSALPGLCLPTTHGGVGFDYRLAMGEPDMWIRLLKETPDEHWDLNYIYYELTIRRPEEKVIGYCESHDQALVGDKTIMFRLCDQEMYWGMEKSHHSIVLDRGVALHKLLRLLTATLGGEGYLTFMGNEFGHPEWIDFPREGNGWSYHYCRRQWSLADNPKLKYGQLLSFEKDMVSLLKRHRVLSGKPRHLWVSNEEKTLIYKRGGLVFALNLHPENAYTDCFISTPDTGKYQVICSTDDFCYGGFGRVYHREYTAKRAPDGRCGFSLYLPNRTGIILKKRKMEE